MAMKAKPVGTAADGWESFRQSEERLQASQAIADALGTLGA